MRWAFVDSWRADSPCLRMARSRNYPMLQKSPRGLCEIEICNYRIGAPLLLNRCCAFQPDVESIFLAKSLNILLQHYLSIGDLTHCSKPSGYSMSSSAMASTFGGTVRPSTLAVFVCALICSPA